MTEKVLRSVFFMMLTDAMKRLAAGRMKRTRLRKAKAIDSFGEIIHSNILRFAAILEEFLHRSMF